MRERDSGVLLLAGLLGIAGVGAASFAIMSTSDEDDIEIPDVEDDDEPSTNLLDSIDLQSDDIFSGTEGSDVLAGDQNSNEILGRDGADQIGGYGGADTLDGNAGDDFLFGGSGDDALYGGFGHDQIHGEDGEDGLLGDLGDDSLFGHSGDDRLFGGSGSDSLIGGAGDDTLFGDQGNDALLGGLDNDSLWGGAGSDVLNGGAGNDVLNGLVLAQTAGLKDIDASDYLNGGGGEDTLIAGENDVVTSSDGADQILVGDWISQGGEAEITDYDAKEDSLMLVWDDMAASASEPDVTVEADPYDDEVMHVLMNGKSVAEVYGDPNLHISDITIIPLSSALIVDLDAA